uniref:Cytochrome b561 domain-containing protein n=1 Tax=Vitrella brassicaformis TaxID=1169539 RepID=A0A7S1KBC0_9ALVE|mmetsp:Transcript_46389/g.115412  ORF Transcript_46389/g.115412 Transcript_46389/m.115412 type:complete len:228 (+) Transcript_46389:64-747(+)
MNDSSKRVKWKLNPSALRRYGGLCASCIGLTANLVIAAVEPNVSIFSGHVIGMASAVGLLLPLSLLSFTALRGATRDFSHAMLNAATVVAISIGFACIYYNKQINKKPHFTTYHSWVGLAAFLAMAAASMGGALYYYGRGFLPRSVSVVVKKVHRTAGWPVFFVGLAAMELAMYSGWTVKHPLLSAWWCWYMVVCLVPLLGAMLYVVVAKAPPVYIFVRDEEGKKAE